MYCKAPFPYFGGKSAIAKKVWQALRQPDHYIEPFFGSGAVLLARPNWKHEMTETVNDKNGFICNVWRSIQFSPDETAKWCDWPVNHCVPGGTMVATPNGNIAIEVLSPGNIVWGEINGRVVQSTIVAVHRSNASHLMRVGNLFITPDHPVWTQSMKYIPTKNLTNGDKIAIFNWPVNKEPEITLFTLSEPECEKMGNLRTLRSTNKYPTLYWRNIKKWATAVSRTFTSCEKRYWQNTPYLRMDTQPSTNKYRTHLFNIANRIWRRMANCRKILDKILQSKRTQTNKLDGWWGRCARASQRWPMAHKSIYSPKRQTISTGETKGYVRKASYRRSKKENIAGEHGQKTNTRTNQENSKGQNRETVIHCPQTENQSSPQREIVDRRAQMENCFNNDKSETSTMHRNGNNLSINNPSSANIDGKRSICKSINTKRCSLQRQPLQIYIGVYNIETTTGNYFANNILVHNCDLMARKSVLLKNEERLLENLIADPLWHDPILAGYWIWAASCWIGSGLTSLRQTPHLGNKGMGEHKFSMTEQRPHLSDKGKGVHKTQIKDIYEWFNQLSYRLRRVRVVCGDWSRVCGGNWQDLSWKTVGIYFDPPYGIQDRSKVYHCDSNTIAQDVMKFCIDRGKRKNYRIVLSGYDEYEKLADYDWRKENWIARGGYSNIAGKKQTRGKINRKRETIWYSPAIGQGGPIQTCLVGEELPSPF